MPKLVQSKKKKICITIDSNLNDLVNKMIFDKKYKGSKSKFIEDAIKTYIGTDQEKLSKQIREAINESIKSQSDRVSRLLAKNAKESYASLFIALKMYAYMCNSEEDEMFIVTARTEAEKQAYQAVRQDFGLENDLETLFPMDKMMDDIESKKGQK